MLGNHRAVIEQPLIVKETVATPLVMNCFKEMSFASHLKQASPSRVVKAQQCDREKQLKFSPAPLSMKTLNQAK